jgi:DNA repair exonuclease SbcCD nuclease subunit
MSPEKSLSPIAVLISDIHFNISTLEVASAALLQAQYKAATLKVPLVIAGDLLDTKAIIRAEVMNRLINIFSNKQAPETIILRGNHDQINEKSEEHALNFLKPYAVIIDSPQIGLLKNVRVALFPYCSDQSVIINHLRDRDFNVPEIVIMHQGLIGSASGEYFQDPSALFKADVSNYRVISGHYHTRQDIKTGHPKKGVTGLFSYIGNPFTLNFGEARDLEKGYQILHKNGLLEFVPTNLRKHVVIEDDVVTGTINLDDIVLVKIRDTRENLAKIAKEDIAKKYGIIQSFKLDLIHTDSISVTPLSNKKLPNEILDETIDNTNVSEEQKARLKALWRTM